MSVLMSIFSCEATPASLFPFSLHPDPATSRLTPERQFAMTDQISTYKTSRPVRLGYRTTIRGQSSAWSVLRETKSFSFMMPIPLFLSRMRQLKIDKGKTHYFSITCHVLVRQAAPDGVSGACSVSKRFSRRMPLRSALALAEQPKVTA